MEFKKITGDDGKNQKKKIQSDLYIVTPYIVTSYKIPLYNHTFEKTNLYKD